jgi:uncharacterized protein YbaR (Trm112 family)
MIATECPVCRGSLRRGPRFGTVQSLQCRSCDEWYTQLIPVWLADALAA